MDSFIFAAIQEARKGVTEGEIPIGSGPGSQRYHHRS
ncbi:hypothetical protein SAMN05421755_103213 [Nitrosomonas sp. Nm33]|nr:hypothetical protein SAMN05421755_103213 [Nitrosomonas sp. Nm33]